MKTNSAPRRNNEVALSCLEFQAPRAVEPRLAAIDSPDLQADEVWFAPFITSYKLWPELSHAMDELQISYHLLPAGARDIWVRDFMPVPTGPGRYMAYTFDPDYLRLLPQYRTDGAIFVGSIMQQEQVCRCPLTLDGGNIILAGEKAILTEKIFRENARLSKREAVRLLEDGLQREAVIIPWDREEQLGHADGVVRYLGNGRVLLNSFRTTDPDYCRRVLPVLQHHFSVEELRLASPRPHKWAWAYLNYLRLGDRIVMPRLMSPDDEPVRRQLEQLTGARVLSCCLDTIIRRGGALNCISWTRKTD